MMDVIAAYLCLSIFVFPLRILFSKLIHLSAQLMNGVTYLVYANGAVGKKLFEELDD